MFAPRNANRKVPAPASFAPVKPRLSGAWTSAYLPRSVSFTHLRRRAIAPGEKAPHHKDYDGAYDGANEPRAFARLIPADRLPDVCGGDAPTIPKMVVRINPEVHLGQGAETWR